MKVRASETVAKWRLYADNDMAPLRRKFTPVEAQDSARSQVMFSGVAPNAWISSWTASDEHMATFAARTYLGANEMVTTSRAAAA